MKIAQMRKKLGFEDESDVVEDPVWESLMFEKEAFSQDVTEKAEKKGVKAVTESKAISKEEVLNSLNSERDQFKQI
jgi:hypothetical protein